MVEKMLVENLNCKKSENGAEHDLKDAFKQGLEGEGVKVSSKQALY